MKNDYWIWPPAEKVGVSVVDEITPELTDIASDSIFADELQVADRFGILKGKRIFSSTEFRALLNAYQDREFLAIDHELHRPSYVVRGDHVEKLEFKTYLHQVFNYDLTWRQSINQSVLASHPGYLVEPLDDATRRKLNLVGKMAFRPLVGPQSPAWAGGIRPDRIIIKFGDLSEDFTPEEFYFLYRIKVVVGGKFELTVLDGPKTRIIHPHSISVLDLPPEAIQMMKDAR